MKSLGFGVGLRREHYEYILQNLGRLPVDWFEALTENYLGMEGIESSGARPLSVLYKVREFYPVVLHGVSLNIASSDPLHFSYLQKLKTLASYLEVSGVSDHLCWTGVNGQNLHDLLPFPYTQAHLDYVTSRVDMVQEALGRTLLLENVSSYISFRSDEMSEAEFLRELTKRTGCKVLLDVNNIYVSASNHGFSADTYLDQIPWSAVSQFHLAGHSVGTHFLVDTHDHPVCPEVWDLYGKAVRLTPETPTLLEWDDLLPSFPDLCVELQKAKRMGQGHSDLIDPWSVTLRRDSKDHSSLEML
jgi:uncharacterized protein (UPF0276 family)